MSKEFATQIVTFTKLVRSAAYAAAKDAGVTNYVELADISDDALGLLLEVEDRRPMLGFVEGRGRSFQSWVWIRTYELVLKQTRSQRRLKNTSISISSLRIDLPEKPVSRDVERDELVFKVIEQLPPIDRSICYALLNGDSFRDLAKKLGKPLATTHALATKAKRSFASAWEKYKL